MCRGSTVTPMRTLVGHFSEAVAQRGFRLLERSVDATQLVVCFRGSEVVEEDINVFSDVQTCKRGLSL